MDGYLESNGHSQYDVSLDDQRFVMLQIVEEGEGTELIMVENWAEELRERVRN